MIAFNDDNAAEARAAEDRRRLAACDEIEMLLALVRDQHPTLPIVDLAECLPEPQRKRLLDLLQELVPFPVEGARP